MGSCACIGLFQVVELYHHVLVCRYVFKWSEHNDDLGDEFDDVFIEAYHPKVIDHLFILKLFQVFL